MKQSNFLFIVKKSFAQHKKTLLYMAISTTILLWCLLILARQGDWSSRGIFDVMVDIGGINGSTNHYMLIVVAIPVLVILLTQIIEEIEKPLSLLTYQSRFSIWHTQVVVVVVLSFVLTIFIIAVSLLLGGVLVGWDNTWLYSSGTIGEYLNNEEQFAAISTNLVTYKIIRTIFLTKFFGFLMISFSFLFLKQLLKNSAFVLIIMYVITGLDHLGVLPFFIYTMNATVSIADWLEPMKTIYHVIYLMVVSMVLYAITGWLYERKDFY
jgi:hypothetical protein